MNKSRLTATILSISLLTVMAGAAVAPALGAVRDYFSDANPLLVQMVVSMPALFIILTNFCFPLLCRHLRTRTLSIVGLLLYVAAGAGAFFADNIVSLLVFRALLGVSVGMLMPLSTGLLAYYFAPQEMARLMGLSAAMNQMGGVVATLLAGVLSSIAWNYAFLVYLLGLAALVMVVLYLPNEHLQPSASAKAGTMAVLKPFHPSVVGMLLLMTIFFVYPTNFALVARSLGWSPTWITGVMVGLDVVAFFVGLAFGKLMSTFRVIIKYFAPIGFLIGYGVMALCPTAVGLMAGSVLIGLANGVGVPYLNTIAGIKGGKDSTTTVMPMLSAALYLGQFVSPLIVMPTALYCFPCNPSGVWCVAVGLCLLFLLQTFLTRKFHRLPPE